MTRALVLIAALLATAPAQAAWLGLSRSAVDGFATASLTRVCLVATSDVADLIEV